MSRVYVSGAGHSNGSCAGRSGVHHIHGTKHIHVHHHHTTRNLGDHNLHDCHHDDNDDAGIAHRCAPRPLLIDGQVVLMDLVTQKVFIHDIESGDTNALVPACPVASCTASSEFMIAPSDDNPFVAGGSSFFRNRFNGRLVRIDTGAGTSEEFDFGMEPGPGASYDGINLWWATGEGGGGVFDWNRIDLDTMELRDSVASGIGGQNAFPAQLANWVWAPTNEGLLQLDPSDLSLIARWDGLAGNVVFAGGRLWASCPNGGCIVEIVP